MRPALHKRPRRRSRVERHAKHTGEHKRNHQTPINPPRSFGPLPLFEGESRPRALRLLPLERGGLGRIRNRIRFPDRGWGSTRPSPDLSLCAAPVLVTGVQLAASKPRQFQDCPRPITVGWMARTSLAMTVRSQKNEFVVQLAREGLRDSDKNPAYGQIFISQSNKLFCGRTKGTTLLLTLLSNFSSKISSNKFPVRP